MLLDKTSEAAEEVGNTINTSGGLTEDKILEMLAMIYLDFDPHTEDPLLPTLIAGASQNQLPPPSEGFDSRFEAIIATKREEWRARENNRKLVD